MTNINTFYPTIEKISEGFVFFSDSTRKAIQKNEQGEEFVRLNNPRSTKPVKIYTNCIKDALEDVRNGYGHAVLISDSFFGNSLFVVRFLDDTIGEKYRQKCIEEFNDCIFGYHIRVMNKNSFSSSFVYENENSDNIRFFKTEEEVNAFIEKTKEDAAALAKRFVELEQLTQENKDEAYIDIIQNTPSVVQLLAFGIAENEETNYLEVIQAIKR